MAQAFLCEFYKISKKSFLQSTSGRQLLQIRFTLCSTYLLDSKNYNICFLATYPYTLCLVRLIYFCLFADFKFQTNKVQSRKFSFAVIENFDTEFILSLLNEEKTIQEISLTLQNMYPDNRDLSIRYLKRCSAKHGISKRIIRNTLDNLIAEAIKEARFGRRHNKVYQG